MLENAVTGFYGLEKHIYTPKNNNNNCYSANTEELARCEWGGIELLCCSLYEDNPTTRLAE